MHRKTWIVLASCVAVTACGSSAAKPTPAAPTRTASSPTASSAAPSGVSPSAGAGSAAGKTQEPVAIASKSPGASATFYGFQQPVSLGKKLGSLAAGYVFGVADVNVCVGADPAAAGAAVADRNSWVLHYANNTVIDPAAIRYEGDPAPEYPFSQSAQVPNACIRGKIVYPVPRDMRPSVISYAPAGTTDVLTWHIN